MVTKQLRKLKYLFIRLLRLKDRTHYIAFGFTIGLIINFVPTFGVGPFLSTVGAKLFRGNSAAGFIGGIALIWTFPILCYLNIIVGEALIPINIDTKLIHFNEFVEAEEFVEYENDIAKLEEAYTESEEVLVTGLKVGKAFFIGMIVNMLFFGLVIYTLIYFVFKKYRIDVLKFIYKKWRLARV